MESTLAGHSEPLQLGHDPGLGVLRDHVARVDAGVVGEERRQPVAARDVEHPVRTSLRDRGDVGGGDGQEVQHVAHRRPVEVAVGLDAPVGQDDRVVDRGRQLASGDRPGVGQGVAGGAGDLGCAPQRVRVLHAGVLRTAVTGDDRRAIEERPQVGGRVRLPRMRPQRLDVRGEHPVGAEQCLDADRCGDVREAQQQREVVAAP